MNIQKLLMVVLSVLTTTSADAKTNVIEQASMDGLEKAVLDELNVARTKPLKYVEYLKEHKRKFDGKVFVGPSGVRIATKEGIGAVDEAIGVLLKQKPLTALKYVEGLSLAARDHAEDTGPKGLTGHDGSDGSDADKRVKRYGEWEKTSGENISYGFSDARLIVLQLIIDDGVPGRGHRTNIFNKDFHVAGIACGQHRTFSNMCVIDFAGGYKDDRQAIRKRKVK